MDITNQSINPGDIIAYQSVLGYERLTPPTANKVAQAIDRFCLPSTRDVIRAIDEICDNGCDYRAAEKRAAKAIYLYDLPPLSSDTAVNLLNSSELARQI